MIKSNQIDGADDDSDDNNSKNFGKEIHNIIGKKVIKIPGSY